MALDHAAQVSHLTDSSLNTAVPPTPMRAASSSARPLASILFPSRPTEYSQEVQGGAAASSRMRSTADEQIDLEDRASQVTWGSITAEAQASHVSEPASGVIYITDANPTPFSVPAATITLAESASVQSPFEFSETAIELTTAFATSAAQGAFSHMCAEL